MLATWKLRNGNHIFFELLQYGVIRDMVFNYIIHHRAQLGVYLRLLNVRIPEIYGPSADEMEMQNGYGVLQISQKSEENKKKYIME